MKISIKPLSVNEAWQGKRFKTPKYKSYEEELFYILPKIEIPKGKLKLDIVVGYSNKLNDIDNFVKPFLDVMQKKYSSFNDRMVYVLNLTKQDVKKGEEYIECTIEEFLT